MPEKCPKCGSAMFNGKPRKPDHGSCCTCQQCGYFYDDCICHVVDGEVCTERQRDLLAAALAVDLNEWRVDDDYDCHYYWEDMPLDTDCHTWETVPCGLTELGRQALRYAIAKYEQEAKDTDEEV